MGTRLTWALCGMAAAAIAIGVGELVAAFLGTGSIVGAVGALIIALQPPGAKDLMVALFGENDKLALEVGTAIGGILVGAILGLVGRRDRAYAAAGFVGFGLVAFALTQRSPLVDPVSGLLVSTSAVLAGIGMFYWLSNALAAAPSRAPAQGPDGVTTPSRPAVPTIPRRAFIAMAAAFVAVGGVLAIIGRYLASQVGNVTPPVAIPTPGATPQPDPTGADFAIDGLTPIIVPNDEFYRIDTALGIPRLDAETWRLRIHGMVDREVTVTYEELLAMPIVEQIVTIACVSNQVGGHLVGNAKWTGTPLVPLLERAGVKAEASQLVGRSFDGWTSGFPTAHLAGAGKDAMLVVAMNGEPLPAAHGFPARLIVPGLYGYVSATKWITEIELTTLDAFDAYWVPLGWAKEAPILTQSRIDLPRSGQRVATGSVEIAGVAWAPTRGISRVEVTIDDGATWREAELSVPLSNTAWIQWRTAVDMPPGDYFIKVRATDGTGETQTAEITQPAPDGARGYHTIRVTAA
jgi:DMSO/TMAO reductase YedYZ molybdopterin-dependent catalytic subunit